MRNRRMAALCVALTAAAVAAGCGAESDGAAATSGSGSAATGEPIVVGTSGPYSSEVIALPEAREAAKAAAESINAGGGVNGRPIVIEDCDDQLDPNQAAACGRKFAQNEDLIAVAGSVSVQGDSFVPVLERNGIADVGAFPVSKSSLHSPVSFPLQGGTYVQYAGAAKTIADKGFKRPVVIYHEIPTISLVLEAVDSTLARSGLKAVGKVPIPASTHDLSAAVAKARTYDPDVVLLAFPEPLISQALLAEHQTGNTTQLITGAGDLTNEALEKLGPAAEGLLISEALPPQNATVEAMEAFHADLDEYAPDIDRTPISLNAWAGVQMLAHVLEGLETVDRESVLEAMNQLSNYDSGGLTPPLDFTAEPALPAVPRLFNTSAAVSVVHDGTHDWDGTFLDVSGK